MSAGEHNDVARPGAFVAREKGRYRDRLPIAGGMVPAEARFADDPS